MSKSEVIQNFSTNPEVIELVDRLWNLSGRDNSTVEAMLSNVSGKEDDAVILELRDKIDGLNRPTKNPQDGGSKKRRNSNKNKKSRRNKKSNKRRRRRQ